MHTILLHSRTLALPISLSLNKRVSLFAKVPIVISVCVFSFILQMCVHALRLRNPFDFEIWIERQAANAKRVMNKQIIESNADSAIERDAMIYNDIGDDNDNDDGAYCAHIHSLRFFGTHIGSGHSSFINRCSNVCV